MVLGKADHVQFGGSTEDIVPIDCVVGERTDRMQFTELQGAINTAPRMYARCPGFQE